MCNKMHLLTEWESRTGKYFDRGQERMSRSLPLPYKPYESTFTRIFLFLERHEFFGSAHTV